MSYNISSKNLNNPLLKDLLKDLSSWGFPEMADSTISVEIDGEISIKIASLPGLFILKLVAWGTVTCSVRRTHMIWLCF